MGSNRMPEAIRGEFQRALFWSRVDVRGVNDCWEWQGAKHPAGYGSFRFEKHHIASRLAYEWMYGEDPGEMHVCHRCDNPPCVNPRHLFLGTNADNVADKVRKGRVPKTRAKITGRQADEIRRLREEGTPVREIAQEYGVCESNVYYILRGDSW